MVCEGMDYFPIHINSYYYVSPKKSNNTIVSLRKIINGKVSVNFYDPNDVIPSSLKTASYNCFSSLTPLHVPIEEHYHIMDESNRIEIIKFEISVSILTQ